MKLKLKNISKSFGTNKVLDELTLEFKSGEIVGLVGVNGVGKTTLLKIIAGLITSYEGSISTVPKIGYLSESNPLYPEMYVTEYLAWLSMLESKIDTWPIGDLMQQVGIVEVASQKINTLSKGYRQRVGLAAALLHQPQVLLLDEPINGLDPVQIKEYHQLIRSIREGRIIVLSSHLIQEIEALCDRVLKLENGVIATDTYLNKKDSNVLRISVQFEIEPEMNLLHHIPHVESVIRKTDGNYLFVAAAGVDPRVYIFDFAVAYSNRILEMSCGQKYLENLF